MILASRPPISIPLTTVPPAVLEELVSELSSLASAYHKPAATFIGKAKFGADGVKNGQGGEGEDDITREKALATVVQGQKSENLLDFGDDDVDIPTNNGGAAGAGKNGAGALGALAGLDDLMMGTSISSPTVGSSVGGGAGGGAGGGGLNDLLGLFDAAPGADDPGAQSGMQALKALSSTAPTNAGVGAGAFGSPMSPTPSSATSASITTAKPAPTSGQDDLLGLF